MYEYISSRDLTVYAARTAVPVCAVHLICIARVLSAISPQMYCLHLIHAARANRRRARVMRLSAVDSRARARCTDADGKWKSEILPAEASSGA